MIKTELLFKETDALIEFIRECDKLGFKNNNSLRTMKFFRTLEEGGAWFTTSVNDKIVGLSGMHKFKDGYRALYRGAQLYSRPGGLTRNHMNCWMFYYHLPMVIDLIGSDPIYITTNTDNDASGSMLRLNKLYYILEKNGIVDHISNEEIFGVNQNVWKLNNERYLEVRGEE